MIVAAGVHVFKLASLMISTLGIGALEEEAFNFVGRVQRVALLFIEALSEGFEDAAHVSRVWLAALIDDLAKDEHLARPENVSRTPVKSAPVDAKTQIAFALRRKASNRRAI